MKRFPTPRFLLGATALGLLAFSTGCSTTTGGGSVGSYNAVARKPTDPGRVRVKVSLQNQAVYVMEGDKPLLVTATCVGTPDHPTPTGNFRAFNKIPQKRSGSYGFWVNGSTIQSGTSGQSLGGRYVGYPMPYWVEFTPAYGFHEGWVHPIPHTHGCLRLHKNVAYKFYDLVKPGTPINIAYSQPEDQTIGKNLPRPRDYNNPDPPASYMVSSGVFAAPSAPIYE